MPERLASDNDLQEQAASWQEAFRVRSYEADPAGRASIQSLCNYLQEAAANHARHLGLSVEQLTEQNYTWVLARLHVEVARYPQWRETVEVETWPSGIEGLYARREFLVECGSPQPIAKATSAWLMVDIRRRRPVRMPDYVTDIIVARRERPLTDALPDLPQPRRSDHEQRFHVRYSDLDVNQHVNNVRYVEWAVEALPQEIIRNYHLSGIEVAFKAETAYGDTITSQAERLSDDPLTFVHRVTRDTDGRDVAVARTTWRKV